MNKEGWKKDIHKENTVLKGLLETVQTHYSPLLNKTELLLCYMSYWIVIHVLIHCCQSRSLQCVTLFSTIRAHIYSLKFDTSIYTFSILVTKSIKIMMKE